jgi:hypothetical protein
MVLKEMGSDDVDWIHMAQDMAQRWAVVITVMGIMVP